MNQCTIDGCERPVVARKLCTKHYQQVKAHGKLANFELGRTGTTLVPVTHPIYKVWSSMKTRCTNENREDYARYGKLGISYAPEWEQFNAFCADMLEDYRSGLWLDRRDGTKGYSKENCRWITPTESNRNRKNVKVSPELAEAIRGEYAAGGVSQITLGFKYNLDQTTISDIVTRRSWK